MESIIPEDPVIVIPSGDWKIVEAVRQHFANAQALELVKKIDSDRNILDKDSVDNVDRVTEQEYAIAEAMADVLALRCPACKNKSRSSGKIHAGDLLAGMCRDCKISIVRGE